MDSIVHPFKNGASPDGILRSFPLIGSLERVYGAITFSLGHKSEVEMDIVERERVEGEFTKTHPASPHLKEKLERVRQQLLARRT